MAEPFDLDPVNLTLEALMRLHAKVDYVIELLEEEADEQEEDGL